MTDGTFVLNFLGQATRSNPDIAYFRPYFTEFTPENWDKEPSGGSFRFNGADGVVRTCVILYKEGLGICLMFQRLEGRKRQTMATLGDATRMQEIVTVGVDELYPAGAFIDPKDAWPMVEQYLTDPTKFPTSEFLKNSAELEWPNPY